ncbi:MAG TPA: hypothetical protein VHS09_16680 [Polyangiaceae bacterium]|nr:hypothetical protein [Polyangiaceae bacterium]
MRAELRRDRVERPPLRRLTALRLGRRRRGRVGWGCGVGARAGACGAYWGCAGGAYCGCGGAG